MKHMRVISPHFRQYGARRLRLGDEFSCADRHAHILTLTGLADYAEAKTAPDSLADLRARYEAMTGNKADGRWSLNRLHDVVTKLEA